MSLSRPQKGISQLKYARIPLKSKEQSRALSKHFFPLLSPPFWWKFVVLYQSSSKLGRCYECDVSEFALLMLPACMYRVFFSLFSAKNPTVTNFEIELRTGECCWIWLCRRPLVEDRRLHNQYAWWLYGWDAIWWNGLGERERKLNCDFGIWLSPLTWLPLNVNANTVWLNELVWLLVDSFDYSFPPDSEEKEGPPFINEQRVKVP